MSLSRGTMLGSCEILEPIGAGGMGEVYRGRDTKLGRDVAVKTLPDLFSKDAERLARFEREAQVLASLNHPNIGNIHELKELGGSKYLILELVEGETLAERIARGPLPLDELLDFARQIAEALEAAHAKGIVHRDLKPANVKITPEGRVKVLDFGLAKIYESVATHDLANSPTLSSMQTAGGVILGTAAYMSPEQARGKNIDQRTDVWAFGCILYEMLTSRQAFPQGETASDTIAGILAREPDWQALPAAIPAKVRTAIERCLRKDANRRLHDMADVRIEIEEARSERLAPAIPVQAPVLPSRRREYAFAALLIVFVLSTAVFAARAFFTAPPDIPVVHFEVIASGGAASSVAISPDGRKVAFVTLQGIWVRPVNSPEAQLLAGTAGGENIFWSPDSQFIGFFTLTPRAVQKVAATGGPPQVLSGLPYSSAGWGTWNAEGMILVNGPPGNAVLRVPAAGGQAAPVTELDKSLKEASHRYPNFLPDGRHFSYLAVGDNAVDRTAYIADLESKERRPLPGIASEAKFSSSGYVIFIRDGTLMAQGFDSTRLALEGEAFPIANPFAPSNAMTGPYSVSMNGDIAYRVVGNQAAAESQLAWFDRSGKQIGTVGPRGEYVSIALSLDNKFVAFQRDTPPDIWVLDIQKGLTSRVTSHPSLDAFAVWSPDGRTLAFRSDRDGGGLYQRAFGVVAEEKLLVKMIGAGNPGDWSRDGQYIAFDGVPETGSAQREIWALPLSGQDKPLRVTKTPFNELAARVSPDGRWIVYRSDEAGRPVPPPPAPQTPAYIYIQSFPEPGIKQQVSAGNGFMPRWSRDGREIFYLAPDMTLMSIPVRPVGSSLETGTPVPLFKVPILPSIIGGRREYEPSSDGRFLINVTAPTGPVSTPAASITVILNWARGIRGQ